MVYIQREDDRNFDLQTDFIHQTATVFAERKQTILFHRNLLACAAHSRFKIKVSSYNEGGVQWRIKATPNAIPSETTSQSPTKYSFCTYPRWTRSVLLPPFLRRQKTYQCCPSFRTISKTTCMSRSTVSKHIKWLEVRGFITTEQRHCKS